MCYIFCLILLGITVLLFQQTNTSYRFLLLASTWLLLKDTHSRNVVKTVTFTTFEPERIIFKIKCPHLIRLKLLCVFNSSSIKAFKIYQCAYWSLAFHLTTRLVVLRSVKRMVKYVLVKPTHSPTSEKITFFLAGIRALRKELVCERYSAVVSVCKACSKRRGVHDVYPK